MSNLLLDKIKSTLNISLLVTTSSNLLPWKISLKIGASKEVKKALPILKIVFREINISSLN